MCRAGPKFLHSATDHKTSWLLLSRSLIFSPSIVTSITDALIKAVDKFVDRVMASLCLSVRGSSEGR
jgi:hypothetical protein